MAIQTDYNDLAQQIYIAYFGRPGDMTGFSNMTAALLSANLAVTGNNATDVTALTAAYSTSATVKSVIDNYGNSTESSTLYGNVAAGQAVTAYVTFVTAIFNNVLGRPPVGTATDVATGLGFWCDALASGRMNAGQAAINIMQGAVTNVTAQGLIDAAVVTNKTTAANSFTAALTSTDSYQGATDAATVRAWLANVDETTASVTTATAAITSTINTINDVVVMTLTTSTSDNLVGTSANEAISGINSSLLSEGTLQGSDKIDGGTGTDTLTVSMKQNFAGFTTGSMKAVETVNLTNNSTAAVSFAATGVTDVTKYVIDASNASITLSDLNALAAVEVTGPADTNTISVGYNAASTVATGSQTDTQSLKVTNVGTANTKTDGTTNAKVATVTIAKVEALALTTAGTANSLNLAAVSDAKTITVTGSGTTEIQAVGTAVTSFDASAATGKVVVDLSNAASGALATAKTGGGDDTITVVADDLTTGVTIAGGTGADKLVFAAGAGKTLQPIMTGVQTVDVGALTTTALTFSGTNVTDLATVNVEGLTAVAASFVNMKATALTINSVANGAIAIAADNAAAVTYNLTATEAATTLGTTAENNTSTSSFANATTAAITVGALVNATGTINTGAAKSVTLNVTGKVVNSEELTTYGTGAMTAPEATALTVSSTGKLSSAAIVAAKATTATITAGSSASTGDTLDLDAAKLTTLTLTAAQNFDFTGSTFTKLQNMTVTTSKAFTMGGVALPDAAAITVGGTGTSSAATFGAIGTATTQTHTANLTATGLKAGLTTGAINAGTSSSTIDISGVTGNATLAAITADGGITLNAKNLAGNLANAASALTTTSGAISVDVSAIGGTATLGALTTDGSGNVTVLATSAIGNVLTGAIIGNNVTVNGQSALGTVIINNGAGGTKDITAKTSVTYTGTNLADNGVDIETAANSTAFTATLSGGAKNEVVTIKSGAGAKQESITVTGNVGSGTNSVTVTLIDNSDATKTQTVNLSGYTGSDKTTTTTTTDLSLEKDGAITYSGSAMNDTIYYSGGTFTSAKAVSITDATTTDSDTLILGGASTAAGGSVVAGAIELSNLTISGIEKITVDDTATVTINASAISGKTIAMQGAAANDVLNLTGTAGNDVIDLSKLTDGGTDIALVITGLAGNDSIIGSVRSDVIIGGNGNDSADLGSTAGVVDAYHFIGTSNITSALNNGGYDTISNFASDDTLAFGSTWLGGYAFGSGSFLSVSNDAVPSDFTAGSDKIIAVAGSVAGAGVSTAISTLLSGASGFASAGSQKAILTVNDGTDTYIWYVNDSIDGTETNLTSTDIVLIGKLTGYATTMVANDFLAGV